MPSFRTTMVATPTVIATEKRNAKKRITALTIDNFAGAGNRRVAIQDRFTPSITNGVPAPAVTLVNRFDAGMIANAAIGPRVFSANDLKNVAVLGQLELIIDVADVGCIASIAWEDE